MAYQVVEILQFKNQALIYVYYVTMILYMKNSTTDMWRNDPEFVYYRINKVNLIYKYKDMYGKHLFEFAFNAGEL